MRENGLNRKEVLERAIEVFLGERQVVDFSEKEVEDIVARFQKDIEAIDKKKVSSNSKKDQANAELVEIVFRVLERAEKPLTVSEIFRDEAIVAEEERIPSIPKVTALLRRLVNDNRVVNVKEKRKSYYSVNKDI